MWSAYYVVSRYLRIQLLLRIIKVLGYQAFTTSHRSLIGHYLHRFIIIFKLCFRVRSLSNLVTISSQSSFCFNLYGIQTCIYIYVYIYTYIYIHTYMYICGFRLVSPHFVLFLQQKGEIYLKFQYIFLNILSVRNIILNKFLIKIYIFICVFIDYFITLN